nr:glycerophosphodiester phosphodiesterase family protein [Chthonobacter rhizosphaerae]
MLSRHGRHVLVIAHRGHWAHAPENSMSAIEAAIAAGADMVEIDTQATADGRLVVIHDETLDRTTDRRGVVADLPVDVVRGARLRHGAGGSDAALTDQRVPLLAEALEAARGRIAVNVDVKYARDTDAVGRLVRDLGVTDEVLLKTPTDLDAAPFAALSLSWFGHVPHMPMLAARPGRFAEDLRRIEALRPPVVEVHFSALDDLASARAELERQDTRLWVNTLEVSHDLDLRDGRAVVDPDGVWGPLIEAGVGAIQTDAVDALAAYLGSRGLLR